jgi:hypothetical protein
MEKGMTTMSDDAGDEISSFPAFPSGFQAVVEHRSSGGEQREVLEEAERITVDLHLGYLRIVNKHDIGARYITFEDLLEFKVRRVDAPADDGD